MSEKQAVLPMDEYEVLVESRKAYFEIQDELKKDCEERGIFANIIVSYYDYDRFKEKYFTSPRVTLITKDSALSIAADEIERLGNANKDLTDNVKALESDLKRITGRNLLERILNKDL